MKKILICGAAGMLGSHFCRTLKEKKIPFIGTTSKQLDITNLDTVSDFVRIQKITHVINCAAYNKVDQAEKEQKEAYLVNAIGPHNLGIAGRRHGARVIHFSTDYVFDGKGHIPYTEEDICSPISAYGLSKLAGELKLLDEHKNACVIRTSWLFGLPGNNFVSTMLRMMQEKEEILVVDDQIGRPTYCQDLVEATLALLDEAGIFHFSNTYDTTRYAFAKVIQQKAILLGFPVNNCRITAISSQDYPTPAKRPSYSCLSTRKIESVLGTTPRAWHDALKDYLTNYKACPQHVTSATS